jgi:hypothetical protein
MTDEIEHQHHDDRIDQTDQSGLVESYVDEIFADDRPNHS